MRLLTHVSRWLAGAKPRPQPRRAWLRVVQLEDRLAPSVSPLPSDSAGIVTPAWFQRVSAPTIHTPTGSALASAGGAAPSTSPVPTEWIVQLSGAALQQVHSVAEAVPLFAGEPVEVVNGLGLAGQLLVRASGEEAAVQAWLDASEFVAHFERNSSIAIDQVPNDPGVPYLWGLHNSGQGGGTPDADIDAPEAWDLGTGSRSVVVGIIDTGIDYTHPDLVANIWTNPGEVAGDGIDNDANGFIDDIHGYDFFNNDSDPMDDNLHGTHVAGTIGATGNNGQGVTGVAWEVSLMALKFLGASGGGFLADAVEAINYATMMKSRYGINITLTNNSWGGGGDQALQDAIAAHGNAGILFVAAAGNDGTDIDASPGAAYPGAYDLPNVITVAASDRQDRLADWSNFGATRVDLAAPGVNIYSTAPGGRYQSLSGTSMATPHVSGALALLAAREPALTAAQLKTRLLDSTDFAEGLLGKVATGRLNARNLLDLAFTRPAVEVRTFGLSLTDAAPGGNNDGQANPGELITIRPTFVNAGTTAAPGATAQIVVSQPGVTVVGPTTLALGDLNPSRIVQPAGSFRLQLAGSLTDLTEVTVSFIVHLAGADQTVATRFHVVKLPPTAQQEVSFQVGPMVADPVRNRVYVLDQSNRRIVAIDTDLGRKVAEVNIGGRNVDGRMTVSYDGTRLFVALDRDQKIQVFALPDFALLAEYSLPAAPIGLAYGANDRLYVTTFNPLYATENPLLQLDATTGQVLSEYTRFYNRALVHADSTGTRLFVTDSGLRGGGEVDEYDIAAKGPPTLVGRHFYEMWFTDEFALDEQEDRIYVQTRLVGGVTVIDTGLLPETRIWEFPNGAKNGNNVAVAPASPFVYAVSFWNGSTIVRFRRSDGAVLGEYNDTAFDIPSRGMVMTPNGKVLYAMQAPNGGQYRLGLIGGSSLTVDPTPAVPLVAAILRNNSVNANGDVEYTVTFNTLVTGVDVADFSLTTTGLTGVAVNGVIQMARGAYLVTVNSGMGDGTLRLNVVDNDGIVDLAGKPLGGVGTGAIVTGPTYIIDKTSPFVVSVTRGNPNPTTAASVPFTVTFNEKVTGVDVSDFALTSTGVDGAAIVSATSTDGRVWIVLVNTGAGNGTIRLDVRDDNSIRDLALNALGSWMPDDGGYTGGEKFTILKDHAPFVVARPSAAPGVVTGTATNLSVLGSDDDFSENDLTYTWSVVSKPAGAADPTYSRNGTNAARTTTATFSRAGDYVFRVTITDSESLTDVDTVKVSVKPSLTGIMVSPAAPTVAAAAPLTLRSLGLDQFGQPMGPVDAAWSLVSGVGTLSGYGTDAVYTAPAIGGGTAVIQASKEGFPFSATTTVSVDTSRRASRLEAEADTYVGEGLAQNFGNANMLWVTSGTYNTAPIKYETYLRFDLRSIQTPVLAAQLRLFGGADQSQANYRVELVANDAWIEGNGGSDNSPAGELVWANRPASTGLVLATWNASPTTSIREIDLTSAVVAELAQDPGRKLSLRISLVSPEGGVGFYSREVGSNALSPQLVIISRDPTAPVETVWVDDALPAGAVVGAEGGDDWTWVSSSPEPYSGGLAHQSNRAVGQHQHFFTNATNKLLVQQGDSLFAYVYLDPANPPTEIMLQWRANGTWDHRAYWGANSITWGSNGTNSRRYLGALPATGGWVRLEVPAALVGLEGLAVDGMAFTLYGGRATWDKAGKVSIASPPGTPTLAPATVASGQVSLNWTPVAGATSYNVYRSTTSGGEGSVPYRTGITAPTFTDSGLSNGTTFYYQVTAVNGNGESARSGEVSATPRSATETVWVDDALPAGAVLGAEGGDAWTWTGSNPAPYAGTLAHQSNLVAGMHQHYFTNATNKLLVQQGDSLFAYVYLDPANPPTEIMLQWRANGSWDHRAYWGANSITWGSNGTNSRRFVGALPAAGGWVRLEVPAALVGLEGLAVDGMAFTLYGGRAAWDKAGKSSNTASPPIAPTLASANAGSGQVALSWSAVTGAATFNVYRSTSSGGAANVPYKTGLAATAFIDSGLSNGTTYYYQVTAVSSAGESARSNEVAATPRAAAVETVWVDDALPAGAVLGAEGGDAWTWTGSNPAPYAGTLAHQSNLVAGMHQHFFTGGTNKLLVQQGDSLFAYVYLDPANPPTEIMLQWHANGSWDHRAYWGANSITWGSNGTNSRRFVGALPAAGGWVRLEVPAALVGLEGLAMDGMAFTLYGGRATWDKAGKAS